ncbi:MAG: 23S rRNA (adenine(2030)-N(6))-methyltransferase RlmJ, partial [Xanthobacteraceae bacterium]
MNYQHAFHAGNFADVHKHVVLTRILHHLRQKDSAFRVIDTHAGAGRYDLFGPEA